MSSEKRAPLAGAPAQAAARWRDRHASLREHFDGDYNPDRAVAELDKLLDAFAQLDAALLAERGSRCAEHDFTFEIFTQPFHYGSVVSCAWLHGVMLGEISLEMDGDDLVCSRPNDDPARGRLPSWRLFFLEPVTYQRGEMARLGPQPQRETLLEWLRLVVAAETIEQVQAQAAALCLSRLRHCAALGAAGWRDYTASTSLDPQSDLLC
jgi:hypothetical protein